MRILFVSSKPIIILTNSKRFRTTVANMTYSHVNIQEKGDGTYRQAVEGKLSIG